MITPKIVARVLYVECPACGEHLEGFVSGPRGAGINGGPMIACEKCHQEFSIPYGTIVELS